MPQRKAMIKIGIIVNEIEPPCGQILNDRNGMISKIKASAVKIAISIKKSVRLDRILKFPLVIWFCAIKKAMRQGDHCFLMGKSAHIALFFFISIIKFTVPSLGLYNMYMCSELMMLNLN